jgi:hypothetical protein
MSWGLICDCDDPKHPMDPRSVRGDLGIRSRCREYALNPDKPGLCDRCRLAAHRSRHTDANLYEQAVASGQLTRQEANIGQAIGLSLDSSKPPFPAEGSSDVNH